ncbi:hypothetical protein [Motilimonas pumila]|uniref:Uncharacterized protein n=1 Tax=Motilimonas pumila TaxID=2303987 RepID=A0A418YGC3_9GAMM|nr:hypothetical protein [Motilimonas pumila]RJG48452.1 hypothetical protein D1Z90_08135 [Motilimonas pumila]
MAQQERRRRGNKVQVLLACLAFASWSLLLVALLLFHYARPELETGLVRYFELDVRTHWQPHLKNYLLYVLWGCSGLSLLSFVINLRYSRRKQDKVWFNFIMLLVICAVSLLFFYLKV